MKALVKSKKAVGIWMEDVPKPVAGPNDVLIRITKTAICGTDVHIYNWDDWAQKAIPVPLVTGHEFAGVIEAVGSHTYGWQVGDRVTGEGHLTCGHCRNCRAGKRHLCRNTLGVGVNHPGCFAEYMVLPASNAFILPPEISDEIASVFDPFGNATHTALSFDLIGEDVLITGAGPIGCMAALIAKHVGARNIVLTEVNPHRIALAEKMGIKHVVDTSKTELTDVMKNLGMVEGFDVSMEMSGNAHAFRAMIKVTNNGGKIALLGIPPANVTVDWNDIVFKGLVIKGIYGREMFESWYKMRSMLESGLDISEVITHHYPIDDFQKGFDVMRSGHSGKVILDWT